MDLGLTGKRAAIAGAASGLGFAAASALAAEGAQVVICSRDQARIDDAAARIGGDTVGLAVDVGSTDGGARFVHEAIEALGGVDILVPNAGGPPPGNFATTPADAYPGALALNLLSVVGMCTAAVPAMRERRWGRVIAITSISVRQPIAGLILSNTARAGTTGFLKTLALEVAGDGITVNSVLPGLHDTARLQSLYGGDTRAAGEGIPAGVVGRPDDFGAVVAFLCSDQARFITGTALAVDGGTDRALI